MILETAQLLSTAVRVHSGYEGTDIYKRAHLNHPCTKWARSTRDNFLWLCKHGLALCDVYSVAYPGRSHASLPIIKRCFELAEAIPEGSLEPFANCSLVKDRKVPITEAYRQTMNLKWQSDNQPPTWRKRNKPEWYKV